MCFTIRLRAMIVYDVVRPSPAPRRMPACCRAAARAFTAVNAAADFRFTRLSRYVSSARSFIRYRYVERRVVCSLRLKPLPL